MRLRPLLLLACLPGCSITDSQAQRVSEPWGGLEVALQAQRGEQTWLAAQISISSEQVERAFAARASSLQGALELELPTSALRDGSTLEGSETEPRLMGLYIVSPGPGDYEPVPFVETGMSVHAPRDAWHHVAGQHVAFGVSRHWDEPGGREYARFGFVLESNLPLPPGPEKVHAR